MANRPNTAEDRLVSMPWWSFPLSIACAVAAIWVILAVTLWAAKPDAVSLGDALRLLPDVVRLIKGLASDPDVPRTVRVELVLVLAFMASPIDIIPDFIPVIGFADDIILVALVLRSVTRLAGPAALTKHWPRHARGPSRRAPIVRNVPPAVTLWAFLRPPERAARRA